jgi:hypothetical protein
LISLWEGFNEELKVKIFGEKISSESHFKNLYVLWNLKINSKYFLTTKTLEQKKNIYIYIYIYKQKNYFSVLVKSSLFEHLNVFGNVFKDHKALTE